MPKINIEEVIDFMDTQMRKAIEDAVYSSVPDAAFDGHSLFHAFKRAVGSECGTWVEIPDALLK